MSFKSDLLSELSEYTGTKIGLEPEITQDDELIALIKKTFNIRSKWENFYKRVEYRLSTMGSLKGLPHTPLYYPHLFEELLDRLVRLAYDESRATVVSRPGETYSLAQVDTDLQISIDGELDVSRMSTVDWKRKPDYKRLYLECSRLASKYPDMDYIVVELANIFDRQPVSELYPVTILLRDADGYKLLFATESLLAGRTEECVILAQDIDVPETGNWSLKDLLEADKCSWNQKYVRVLNTRK